MENLSIEWIIVYGSVLFLAIGIHEYAHCKVADLSGDPTPALHGRVTLNLTKHFEPLGTIMIILTTLTGFGIGWGKPAPIDPSKMRNPRWDTLATVLAGPVSNVIQAAVWAILLRVLLMLAPGAVLLGGGGATTFGLFLILGVFINLMLAIFNLIPLGPLDGHWIVGQLLPEKPRLYWYRFNRTYGNFLMLALILGSQFIHEITGFSPIGDAMFPIADAMFKFFTGLKGLQ